MTTDINLGLQAMCEECMLPLSIVRTEHTMTHDENGDMKDVIRIMVEPCEECTHVPDAEI